MSGGTFSGGTWSLPNGLVTTSNGGTLTFTWTGDFTEGTATGVNPTVHFAGTGSHTVTLVVNDGTSNSAPDDVAIEIQDTLPPDIQVSGLTTQLWPPNHKLVTLTPTVTAVDQCDTAGTGITLTLAITSNESDNGTGDGNTTGDIVIRSASDFDLVAERSGGGSGRVYTLVWTATDAAGNTATLTQTVTVPHDMGHGSVSGGSGDDDDDEADDGDDADNDDGDDGDHDDADDDNPPATPPGLDPSLGRGHGKGRANGLGKRRHHRHGR